MKQTIKLSSKQEKIIDAIADKNIKIVMADGDRRCGLTTSGFIGICQCINNGTQRNWGLWATTKNLAMKIYRNLKSKTSTEMTFKNGSIKIKPAIHEKINGIWIDEAHSILKDNPEFFKHVSMRLREDPNIKLVITSRSKSSEFDELKKTLKTIYNKHELKIFKLRSRDATHFEIVEASMGL